MKRIPVPLREAAFYLGVAQLTLREAGELLNVPYTRLGDRYRYALDELLVRLNG
jgi:DNA-directed RNA polymerase specialized sigma24 family protein